MPADREAPSATQFVEMVFPEHANHYGTLFGGEALNLMGKAAFVAATRRARRPAVMAATDKVDFRRPVAVGELVEFTARVERLGQSSMTVVVEGVAESPVNGDRTLAMRGQFEMMAVDDAGRPVPISRQAEAPLSVS